MRRVKRASTQRFVQVKFGFVSVAALLCLSGPIKLAAQPPAPENPAGQPSAPASAPVPNVQPSTPAPTGQPSTPPPEGQATTPAPAGQPATTTPAPSEVPGTITLP